MGILTFSEKNLRDKFRQKKKSNIWKYKTFKKALQIVVKYKLSLSLDAWIVFSLENTSDYLPHFLFAVCWREKSKQGFSLFMGRLA